MREDVRLFLRELRDHPLWTELLKEIEAPMVRRYRPGKGSSQEVRDDWVYWSGRRDEYDKWFRFLAGDPPAAPGEDA